MGKLPLFGILLLLMIPGVQAANNEGEQLLKSMQSAVHALNYSGNLVFWKGNEMSEYHIEHQSGQGNSSETLIKLDAANGAASHRERQFSLVNASSLQLPAQQVYSIDLGQDTTIAGLPCKVVVIRPKDKMRYLYRYCIHPDSGMLLKYSVMNRQQQLLEQFMFTRLNLSPVTKPDAKTRVQKTVNNAAAAEIAAVETPTVVNHWDLSQLPTGFSVQRVQRVPDKENTYQIILSDGLTHVSVFIEPDQDNNEKSNKNRRKAPASGATNILTAKKAGHVITLVGEVPSETLNAIQNGLRYATP